MLKSPSPFSIANIRLFILFRILFNSRFYYPVFTILFLDYGLTIEHFPSSIRSGRSPSSAPRSPPGPWPTSSAASGWWSPPRF